MHLLLGAFLTFHARMNLPLPLLRWTLAFATTAVMAFAELAWDTSTQEKPADFGQEEIPFTFAFTNRGDQPVTIQAVEVSCGCTATSLTKTTFAPGERGELEVVYRPDGQTGPQTKTIVVTSSDQPKRPVTLTVKTNVPRLVEVSPRLVTWPRGGEPTEKRVSITLHRLPQTTVTIENPQLDHVIVSLQPGDKAGSQMLVIRPKSTVVAFRATIRLRIESEGLPSQILAVYADLR